MYIRLRFVHICFDCLVQKVAEFSSHTHHTSFFWAAPRPPGRWVSWWLEIDTINLSTAFNLTSGSSADSSYCGGTPKFTQQKTWYKMIDTEVQKNHSTFIWLFGWCFPWNRFDFKNLRLLYMLLLKTITWGHPLCSRSLKHWPWVRSRQNSDHDLRSSWALRISEATARAWARNMRHPSTWVDGWVGWGVLFSIISELELFQQEWFDWVCAFIFPRILNLVVLKSDHPTNSCKCASTRASS